MVVVLVLDSSGGSAIGGWSSGLAMVDESEVDVELACSAPFALRVSGSPIEWVLVRRDGKRPRGCSRGVSNLNNR